MDYDIESRNRVVRTPERGNYDRDVIYGIVDEALYCHVGFESDGQPFVIPTIHARHGDELIIHGATSSRLIRHVQGGREVCVTITILDGLVLARSIYHHSMNYRSAILFGKGRLIEDREEKLQALKILSDHLLQGRWEDVRKPNANEFKATSAVAISIDAASAKIRSGPPKDENDDYALKVWAGVIPIRQQYLEPEADPLLDRDVTMPDYLAGFLPRR